MDVNNLNNILDAFKNVLPQLGLQNVQKGSLSLKGRFIDSPGVVVIIGLMGDIKGNIIYGMTDESAKIIASKMMMGMPIENLDELAQSALSELVNMLTANAATNFANNGITVDISTPTLIYGEFTANASSDKVICVEMKADDALIEVNIALEKDLK